jgi:hypothetical protein
MQSYFITSQTRNAIPLLRAGGKNHWPGTPVSPPPPVLRASAVKYMPRFLMPAKEFICFRSLEAVKEISQHFLLMKMKRLLMASCLIMLFYVPEVYHF